MTDHVITVGSPRVEGKMGSKYTSYSVTTTPQDWEVRRRYSEFGWLRSMLLQRYPGMFVPTIPSKVKAAAISSEKRMYLLGCFLDQLAATELLGDDEATIAFLSISDHGEWAKMLHGVSSLPTERTLQWSEACLAGNSSPTDAGVIAQEIKVHQQRLANHDKQLTKLLSSSKTLAKASQSLSSELKKVGAAAESYAASEESGGEAAIKESLTNLAHAFRAWGTQSALEPVVFQRIMAVQVEYQIQQVGGFKELLTAREAMVVDLEKRKKKLSELEAQKASGHTETKGSKFGSYSRYMPPSLVAHKEPLADAISAESKGVIDTKEALKVVTNALFEQEFERFDADRGLAYKRLVGMVAVGMLKVQADVQQAWQENDAGMGSGTEAEHMKQDILKVIPNFEDYGSSAAAQAAVLDVEAVELEE